MDESEDMSVDKTKIEIHVTNKEKTKKRSLVERELETSLTARVTSPLTNGEGTNTSRYGRARRLKSSTDFCDTDKSVTNFLKSHQNEKSTSKCQPTSPVYKMQASNSLIHETSPKLVTEANLENQIENIYNVNISLSRFGFEEKNGNSPAKKFSKVYTRKDLSQSNEKDDPASLTKSSLSPAKSTHKSNSHLNNILERSSEKYSLPKTPQNGYLDNASVVKTLDFDCSKNKRKKSKESKSIPSKSNLFKLEAECTYQVGDIAWARMGTFPYWPCIVTREPGSEIFVRMKLFGKSEHEMIHVTFFGDNGRRSWIIDNMLRKYQGLAEFESVRDQFTPEAKKKDPKLYAAFFVSDKKLPLWHTAIEEAEILHREPKRLRIDILYKMLGIQKPKNTPLKAQKSSKVTRTDSDVSLSESLFDSLFSEADGKVVETGFKKNKSLDVSEVVTACLDNMAAKSGITMIQRQSHMDIWLQKAKSKTPEKLNITVTVERLENERKSKSKERDTKTKSKSKERDMYSKKKKKSLHTESPMKKKPYSFRKSTESRNLFSHNNEHDYSKNAETVNKINNSDHFSPQIEDSVITVAESDNNAICVIEKIESFCGLEMETKTQCDEIHEEIVSDTDHSQDEVTASNTGEGDSEINMNNSKIIAMDFDNIEISNKEIQTCKDAELSNELDISNINNDVECPVSENKETDAFTVQTAAKVVDLFLQKTDNDSHFKQNKNDKDEFEMSFKIDNNMSIDNDANCSQSNQNNLLFDEQNKEKINFSAHHETAKSDPNESKEMVQNDHQTNEKSTQFAELQEGQVKRLDTEPKNKLSVIKEASVNSFQSTPSNWDLAPPKRRSSRKIETKKDKHEYKPMDEPEFLLYLEMRQDAIIDEYPDLSQKEIADYLYKTWQFETNTSSGRKSKSPIEFVTVVKNEEEKLEDKSTKVNQEESQTNAEVPSSQPNSKIKTASKRSLSLNKSSSPLVTKKIEHEQEKDINDSSKCLQLPSTPKITEQRQKRYKKKVRTNTDAKISTSNNINKVILEHEKTVKKDIWLVTAEKSGISLRLSKAFLEPKVVLERKKDLHSNFNLNLSNYPVHENKSAEEQKNEIVSNVESGLNCETKFSTISNKLKLNTESVELAEDKQPEVGITEKPKSIILIPDMQSNIETESQNGMSDFKDVTFKIDDEAEVPLSKRRSLRLRKSQSPSRLREENQEQHNDQSALDQTTHNISESKHVKSEHVVEGDISDNVSNQNESSSNTIIPVEVECSKGQDANANADSVSLASDLTNGFIDHSSDKDFDPETVSLNSLSSEFSNVSEMRAITDTNKIFRKLLESDNESVSSLDNITLSELKTRSKTEQVSRNLKQNIENSMDSVKSDNSDRKLRLVLTDCLLKDSKLPVIKEVRSKANEEFEISQSNVEICKSEKPSSLRSQSPLTPLVNGFGTSKSTSPEPQESVKIKKEVEKLNPDPDTISIKSSNSDASSKRKGRNRQGHKPMEEPEFLQYLEMRQDALIDEHPEVTPSEVAAYLYKTWHYEESLKSDLKKNDDIESSNLVKGANPVIQEPPKKKKAAKKKLIDIDKIIAKSPAKDRIIINKFEIEQRELPKRKASKAFYNEDYSDIEDEIEMFEIFKTKPKPDRPKADAATSAVETVNVKLESKPKDEKIATEAKSAEAEVLTKDSKEEAIIDLDEEDEELEHYDEVELYFEQLTSPKPNIFKGLIREKVCEICEKTYNLVKCKGCNGMFHLECVKKEDEFIETPAPTRGRKKKKKPRGGRKPKISMDSNEESHSDEKSQDLNASEENMSMEEVKDDEPIVIPDADNFESQLEAKMKEFMETGEKIEYDSYSSDDGIDWSNTVVGKCEIVDIKPKTRPQSTNTDDFKCKNCQKDDTPICFVCKSPVSPKNNVERRQKCQVAHCHKYYHLECLEHWPQTQFNAGEPSKNNKKLDEHFEAMTCPRHVCHTCVCDDPRGCKTRFSGDKLARCVRCPATYHSFTKCLPAGSQILSASHIVCPRHYEHRPGKIPYHVNTGWCFICALGGNLICCDYCPTSFHADCLNIEPPEGGYMCEDCETGRLPLYGEMVWVKLGHYRWWPGIVLHPSEIPDNILAVKHSPGEFVVRFFGQYDHYWVNRGRVFPFQEGDSGRISTQKSKIDEAFTKAMEHAQRAFEILKNVEPNDEENQDIQSSLLPPHYVKLKVNKPCGALYGRKVDIEESSLTQCECNPDEEEPCGPYSHCLNRMLLTECGPICRAGERCQNRAFEKRQYPKMVPYRTPHRGWGLKTLEPIKAGQFVIEYVGELIDEAEFRRRMQRKHDVRDENFYFLTLDKERMIDAGPKGNLARFMNHCCEPNCETQKWTVLGDIRVGLFAIRDIPANTEVTFNYNLECNGIEKKQCMCGAKRCAGYIGAKPKQDEPQPKKVKLTAKRPYKKRKITTESQSPSAKLKPKRPVGRPAKPRELTDIEKDLLIIKNATNGLSSDSECSGRLSSADDKDKNSTKALKRKRVSFSTEDTVLYNGCSSPSVKKMKLDDYIDKIGEVVD